MRHKKKNTRRRKESDSETSSEDDVSESESSSESESDDDESERSDEEDSSEEDGDKSEVEENVSNKVDKSQDEVKEDVNNEEDGNKDKVEESDASKSKWIFDRILDMPNDEIGKCSAGNRAFVGMAAKLEKVRQGHDPVDYHSVSKAIATFLEDEEFKGVFSNFRGIYEFIIYVHRLYAVKLNPDADDEKDALLLSTMSDTFRKFTSHFGRTQKSY